MTASARISYAATSPLGGEQVANAIHNLVAAQNQLSLAVRILGQVTNQDVDKANVEGSAEFGVQTGKGAEYNDGVVGLWAALNTVMGASIVPKLWQG